MGLLNLFKKKRMKPYYYSETELNEYENFIEKNFGSYDKVLHEIVSPDIHLDVILIPPTEDQPFYKLVTMGMGAYPMNVPKELTGCQLEHAELILFLPPDWNMESQEEKDFWPIGFLKQLGRLPLYCNTWLGHGHTIQAKEDKTSFAENTNLNNVLLLAGIDYNNVPLDLKLSSGKYINFYHMVPIYQEELEYKSTHSVDELLDKFDDEASNLVLNINRKNFCI